MDEYLAYKHFCPRQWSILHADFLRELTQALLDNKMGCAPGAPVLRPRKSNSPTQSRHVHSLRRTRSAPYYAEKIAAAKANGEPIPRCDLRCRVCGVKCSRTQDPAHKTRCKKLLASGDSVAVYNLPQQTDDSFNAFSISIICRGDTSF